MFNSLRMHVIPVGDDLIGRIISPAEFGYADKAYLITMEGKDLFAETFEGAKQLLIGKGQKPSGGISYVKVPIDAHEILAEGEFNRFYCRGVCRRAIEDGILEVIVYRAKSVDDPCPE